MWSLQKGFLCVSSSFTLLSAFFIYCHIFIYFMLNALNLCPYWFHAWPFEYCSSKTEAILMYISHLIWNILCNKHTLWTLPCSCPISELTDKCYCQKVILYRHRNILFANCNWISLKLNIFNRFIIGLQSLNFITIWYTVKMLHNIHTHSSKLVSINKTLLNLFSSSKKWEVLTVKWTSFLLFVFKSFQKVCRFCIFYISDLKIKPLKQIHWKLKSESRKRCWLSGWDKARFQIKQSTKTRKCHWRLFVEGLHLFHPGNLI